MTNFSLANQQEFILKIKIRVYMFKRKMLGIYHFFTRNSAEIHIENSESRVNV